MKKRARLNMISHLLGRFEYEDLTPKPIELPMRPPEIGYDRPPVSEPAFVPEIF